MNENPTPSLADQARAAVAACDLTKASHLLREMGPSFLNSEIRGGLVLMAAKCGELAKVGGEIEALVDDAETLSWLFCHMHPNLHAGSKVLPEYDLIRRCIAKYVDNDDFKDSKITHKNAAIAYALYSSCPQNSSILLQEFTELCTIHDFAIMFAHEPLCVLLTKELACRMACCRAGVVALMQITLLGKARPGLFPESAIDVANSVLKRVQPDIPPFFMGSEADSNAYHYYMHHRFGSCATRSKLFCDIFNEYDRKFPTPPRVQFKRKPRVALCVAGQLRGYRKAFESWSVLRNIPNLDIFVHAWRNVGQKSLEWAHAERLLPPRLSIAYRTAAAVIGSGINRQLPHLISALNANAQVDEEGLATFYGAKKVVIEDEPTDWTNFDKMYYKHAQAIGLAEGYDFIIRIRPDKKLGEDCDDIHGFIRENLERNVIFVDLPYLMHFSVGFVVGDQVLMGRSDLVKRVSQAYDERKFFLERGFRATKISDGLFPHSNLAAQLAARNIDVEDLPFTVGDLLDASRPNLLILRDALRCDVGQSDSSLLRDLLISIDADIDAESQFSPVNAKVAPL